MNTFRSKLKQTIPTYLLLILTLVILYSVGQWAAKNVLNISVDDKIWTVFIPVLLPLLTCIYFLNRKFNLVDFPVPLKARISIIVVTLITASALLIMLAGFTKESKEMLVELPNVTAVDTAKTVKYFELKEYGVNRRGGYHINYTKSRNRNSNLLHLNIYFALPLLKDKKEGIMEFPRHWYGLKFSMGTNGGKASYMRALEQEFLKECQQKITAMTFDDEKYFELVTKPAQQQLYENAINSIPIPKEPGKNYILIPSFKYFNQKAIEALYWMLGIFAVGTFMFILGISDLQFKQNREAELNSGKDS
ncbi:MAG: hypothetical protein EOO85_22565 [Pedobacter sp.]|nr:MAG: hypothetical protein EOO85_22565 [Pedobacter sp.]